MRLDYLKISEKRFGVILRKKLDNKIIRE